MSPRVNCDSEELGTETVLVEVSATHMCEAMRGVETETATTTRATVGGPTEAERRRFADATHGLEEGR